MNGLYHAKEVGVAQSGSRFIVLQDGPASFHISVSKDHLVLYDHLENPTSIEQIHSKIAELENDLLSRLPTLS